MVRKALITTLFRGFTIQRWNDKIRPVTLTEIDKNAHKMVIAYCLGKCEEEQQPVIWDNIIKGGIFEYFRRVVLSDIKSPVYRSIKDNYAKEFKLLNKWVFDQLKHFIPEGDFKNELHQYLVDENCLDPLSRRILSAAHVFASYWEFKIIKQANPDGYQIKEIESLILRDISKHLDLIGMQKLLAKQIPSDFVDLVGQLRFQVRWSQTPRLPETSILGHCMLVAILAYMFSHDINACSRRQINNFFGGLFHDLPEALTRDIISPVKTATPGMPEVIRKIELQMAETELYKTIENEWKEEIQYYITEDDKSKIKKGKVISYVSSDDITKSYNSDKFNPLDGEIIKAADHLATYMEAYAAKATGIQTKDLEDGLHRIAEDYKDKSISGIDISAIYADFSS